MNVESSVPGEVPLSVEFPVSGVCCEEVAYVRDNLASVVLNSESTPALVVVSTNPVTSVMPTTPMEPLSDEYDDQLSSVVCHDSVTLSTTLDHNEV